MYQWFNNISTHKALTYFKLSCISKIVNSRNYLTVQHADCTYVLLGLYNGTPNFDPVGKSEEVIECVRRRLHEWNDRLGNNLRISIQ